MRMKKQLVLAALVAIAATACTKTFQVQPTSEIPVGFGTWTETLTKARGSGPGTTAFQAGDAFDVFGFKTVGSDNHVVFNGDDVTATVSESTVTWDYAPHRYWDPAASSYTFFAVLPAGILAAEESDPYATTGKFTSIDFVFDDPAAMSNDILVADKKVASGAGTAAPYSYAFFQTGNYVQMQFNHIASCVDLLVKQDDALGDAVVKVTALSLLNISNTGHFAVSAYDGSTNVPTVAWTEASPATTLGDGEYIIISATEPVDHVTVTGKTPYTEHTAGTTTGTLATLFSGYVFMPQTLIENAQQIKISYTIQVGEEEPNAYTDLIFDIRNFMTTDTDNNSGTQITAWERSTKYIYTLTIGANAIKFSATVKDWADTVNGYHYLVQ